MRLKDLIKGEIYTGLYNNKKDRYVFMCLDDKAMKGDCPHLFSGRYVDYGDLVSSFDGKDGYVLATPEEKQHFLACKNAGKYVKPPEQPLELLSSFIIF